ncbi:tRNA (adenine-N(1))-methyltransferase [Bacillus sp. BHET2]|uniref:tRNA (adenine(22)-N(1))-methyltransferase n=1 Tax=Bacillus sp. BHET2 TaxID=2583818 RepID=UPI00110E0380|nr:tRNA (adenine(22)-N(1))-methyltransferase TrmK [Bacillus sp. BHET2]TMU86031.1 tRNA (adenine-N(1))-methyltransferase [Bacillus sp. BHET2]
MNIQQLSKRLETVVSYIPENSKIADIGSDHAYLPCYAVNKGIASFAVAGEVVKGPYLSAKKQVEDAQLTKKVEVRLGNGLEVLAPGEVDCITIAGMGGALIASILEAGKDKLSNGPRLILQPNVSASSIRTWLMDNEWSLIGEDILEEDDKLYEIVIAEKGDPRANYSNEMEKELLLGPFLMNDQSEAFKKKWNQELHQWKKIINNMERAEKTDALVKRKRELIQKIQMVEEVLTP